MANQRVSISAGVDIMRAQKEVQSYLGSDVLDLIRSQPDQGNVTAQQAVDYLENLSNVFVFEKDEVMRFFEGGDYDKMEYFAVILGAEQHNGTFRPTVILAACEEDPMGNPGNTVLKVLGQESDALDEHPPSKVIDDIEL